MSKCWYCNNELTSEDNPKHFGICNKCYDEMFKSGDTIIRSLTNKIAELEKQLEEKDKEIETKNIVNNLYKTTVSLRDNDFKDLVYENNSLKQQLKSQPAKIVEKIGGEIYTRMVVEGKETKYTDINLILNTILKEYQK